jgi:HD-like signal output (HDOD) protein
MLSPAGRHRPAGETAMSATTDGRQQVVSEAIREISHIATLPEVTLKIIQLVETPSSTAQDLHQVISSDPALCARILKVVNSSFYGLPGQIASINRAIVMLGLNAVKNIAIAASLAKLFRGGELAPSFSAKSLWQHSISTAATTRILGNALGFGFGDEAFLGGLIHDIGLIVEMQYDRNRLIEVIERVDGDDTGAPAHDMLEAEKQVFGADHQDFGHALCERWKFPMVFQLVTGFHHRPLSAPPENRTVVGMVYVADRLVAGLGSFRLDLPSLDIDPAVMEQIRLTPENLSKVRQSLPEQLKSVDTLLA